MAHLQHLVFKSIITVALLNISQSHQNRPIPYNFPPTELDLDRVWMKFPAANRYTAGCFNISDPLQVSGVNLEDSACSQIKRGFNWILKLPPFFLSLSRSSSHLTSSMLL